MHSITKEVRRLAAEQTHSGNRRCVAGAPGSPDPRLGSAATPEPVVASIVEQNIRSLLLARQQSDAARGGQERAAAWLTFASGTMAFVYFHAAWFVVWMVLNAGVGGLPTFDPFPFGLLTMMVSLEAIFLSTFVLISQNRSAALAGRRSDLDLQTNLLTEHEITRSCGSLRPFWITSACGLTTMKRNSPSWRETLVQSGSPSSSPSSLRTKNAPSPTPNFGPGCAHATPR